MAKNEKIIAQDLAEIKHALQTSDTTRFYEMCEVLTREIKKYPVKPDVVSRIKKIIEHPSQPLKISLDKKVEELNDLIEILISR